MCWEKMNPDNKEKENDSLTEKKRNPKKKNKIFRPNKFKQKKW
jgi:hypothetical protein